jgi:hypothetical protein
MAKDAEHFITYLVTICTHLSVQFICPFLHYCWSFEGWVFWVPVYCGY